MDLIEFDFYISCDEVEMLYAIISKTEELV